MLEGLRRLRKTDTRMVVRTSLRGVGTYVVTQSWAMVPAELWSIELRQPDVAVKDPSRVQLTAVRVNQYFGHTKHSLSLSDKQMKSRARLRRGRSVTPPHLLLSSCNRRYFIRRHLWCSQARYTNATSANSAEIEKHSSRSNGELTSKMSELASAAPGGDATTKVLGIDELMLLIMERVPKQHLLNLRRVSKK